MSDTTTFDPNTPLGELKEPEFPLLAEVTTRCTVRSFEKRVAEKTGNPYISLAIVTTKDHLSTEGHKLGPGIYVRSMFGLVANENRTLRQLAEEVAMPIKAILGSKEAAKWTWNDILNRTEDVEKAIKDKPVDVKIGVRRAKKDSDYSDQNVVKTWIIPNAK